MTGGPIVNASPSCHSLTQVFMVAQRIASTACPPSPLGPQRGRLKESSFGGFLAWSDVSYRGGSALLPGPGGSHFKSRKGQLMSNLQVGVQHCPTGSWPSKLVRTECCLYTRHGMACSGSLESKGIILAHARNELTVHCPVHCVMARRVNSVAPVQSVHIKCPQT